MFTYFVTTWQKKPYICNQTPSQSVRKLAVIRFEKTASRLTAIFLPRWFVNYLLSNANIQTFPKRRDYLW